MGGYPKRIPYPTYKPRDCITRLEGSTQVERILVLERITRFGMGCEVAVREEGYSIKTSRKPPPLRLQVFFWLLLGMLSTAFAEVTAGSTKFPFFEPWGILVVTPLYSLHILVLATILVRYRRLSWPGLCFAGALFGLYEAYLTKVLWHPDWFTDLAVAGEVRWLHVVLLVLWWHPFLAFIIPLLVGELLLTRSRTVLGVFSPSWQARLTGRSKRWVLLFAVVCGILTATNALPGAEAILSPLVNGALMLGLITLWRRTRGPEYSLAELLPGPRAFAALATALGVMYVCLGAFLLPERLPGPVGHVLVWVLYGVFVGLLVRSPRTSADEVPPFGVSSLRWPAIFVVVVSATTLILKVILGGASVMLLLPTWFAACTIGVFIYARAAYRRLLG